MPSCLLLYVYQAPGNHWVLILTIGLIAAALGIAIAFILKKTSKQQAASLLSPAPNGRAKLMLPDNIEITLAAGAISIGRESLARAVPVENLVYISHQHFAVSFENGKYTITDLDSLNGTKLNGIGIKGEGKKVIKDGDRITIAEVSTIIFKSD